MMTTYEKGKAKAREEAQTWQHIFYEYSYSFFDLYIIAQHFEKLAKRYGLIKEFKENGIL